jgi:hypothetical protein
MRNELLQDLSRNSETLSNVSSMFKSVLSAIQMVTFYETEIMAPLKCPVRGDALAQC